MVEGPRIPIRIDRRQQTERTIPGYPEPKETWRVEVPYGDIKLNMPLVVVVITETSIGARKIGAKIAMNQGKPPHYSLVKTECIERPKLLEHVEELAKAGRGLPKSLGRYIGICDYYDQAVARHQKSGNNSHT